MQSLWSGNPRRFSSWRIQVASAPLGDPAVPHHVAGRAREGVTRHRLDDLGGATVFLALRRGPHRVEGRHEVARTVQLRARVQDHVPDAGRKQIEVGDVAARRRLGGHPDMALEQVAQLSLHVLAARIAPPGPVEVAPGGVLDRVDQEARRTLRRDEREAAPGGPFQAEKRAADRVAVLEVIDQPRVEPALADCLLDLTDAGGARKRHGGGVGRGSGHSVSSIASSSARAASSRSLSCSDNPP